MPSLSRILEARLAAASGRPLFLGELVLLPARSELERELRHRADTGTAPESLVLLPDLPAIREIAKNDAAWAYRPLRVAPGLQRGWRTEALSLPALIEALHSLYPSALPFWAVPRPPVPFSETAKRQSGMYRLVQTCGDEGAPLRAAVEKTCAARCLRQRLWGPGARTREEIERATPDDAIPLPCPEACNYLIAQVREEIDAARKQ